MMGFTDFLAKNLDEAMRYEARNPKYIVQELMDNCWSRSNKALREACRKLEELGYSDKKLAKEYLKEMDKYSTKIGKKLMEQAWDDMEDDEVKEEPKKEPEKEEDGMEEDQDGVNLNWSKFLKNK